MAVAAKGAKIGMMLYEVKRAAATVAGVLRTEEPAAPPVLQAVPSAPAEPSYAPQQDTSWSSYAPNAAALPAEPPAWS